MLGFSWLSSLRLRRPALSKQARQSRRRTARYRTARLGQVESLECRTLLTPVIASFDLYADTDTPGDYVTSDPRVTGTVTCESPYDVELEFDYDGDGSADEWGTLDSEGMFVQNPEGYIGQGAVTISVRAGEMDWNLGGTVYSDWVSLSFTWEEAPPQVTAFAIANAPAEDPGVSLDGVLNGQVEYAGGDLGFVSVEIDYTEDGVADDYATLNGDGTFTWDMNNSAGFGTFTVRARATDTQLGTAGDWATVEVSHISPPEITEFSAVEEEWHEFSLSGFVYYDYPLAVTIQVSGVASGTLYPEESGWFGENWDIDQTGFLYVVAIDEFGRESNVWEEYILVS